MDWLEKSSYGWQYRPLLVRLLQRVACSGWKRWGRGVDD